MKFTEFNLDSQLLEAIEYMGFTTATPIQEKAIPAILGNKDLIACAQTGTGKTGAFVVPILNKLIDKKDKSIDTLIIVPTRELAIQIEQEIQALSYFVSVGSQAVYGGTDGKTWEDQKKALKYGIDIVVATPGKLISHLQMGYVDFKSVKHLILDEADRMLDMGFIDDINKIITYLPKKHQTLLFSATMPKAIKELAKRILHKPEEISLSISKPAEGVNQQVYLTHDAQKDQTLSYIISERTQYDSIIIFTSTKSKVNDIVTTLRKNKHQAKGISSNLDQKKREEVLSEFRSKRVKILVATDVMSRGIDIKEINMVINYDVPQDPEDYVHRVGRTARAESKGEAITFVNPKDMYKFQRIETLIESSIQKNHPPEEIGKGPEWQEKSSKPKKNNFRKKKFYKKSKPKK